MTGEAIIAIVWLGGMFVGGCFAYEFRASIEKHLEGELVPLPIIFWPLTIGVGALWLASWTVRGPIRLVRRWLVMRDVDPESIRCADSKAMPRAWTVRR